MTAGNLFANLPADTSRETSETLLDTADLRLERIVSFGQATPPGEWYDQPRDEWVVLLRGHARVLFEGEPEPRSLHAGDTLHISAQRRHRVTWTAQGEPTVWLALHHRGGKA